MKTDSEKLREITEKLPEYCADYLLHGQSGNSTLTAYNYARDLLYFFEFAKNYLPYFCDKEIKYITIDDIKQITADDVNIYLTSMKERFGLAEKTRARRKSALSNMFKYLINTKRVLDYNPTAGAVRVKIPERDYVLYLNMNEQTQLLNCIIYGTGLTKTQLRYHQSEWKRDLAIVFLFLDTGLRISELQGLNIKDCDWTEHCVHVTRKGGKKQKVYFSDEACEYIKDYITESRKNAIGDDPLFISGRGDRIAVRSIQAMLAKYVKAALPGKAAIISPHKLRSSFAMEFYKNSKDILLLQKRMGHKSIIATNIYAKAADEELVANSRNWRQK